MLRLIRLRFIIVCVWAILLVLANISTRYIPLNSWSKLEKQDYTINADGIPCCPYDPALPMKPEGSKSNLRNLYPPHSRSTGYKFQFHLQYVVRIQILRGAFLSRLHIIFCHHIFSFRNFLSFCLQYGFWHRKFQAEKFRAKNPVKQFPKSILRIRVSQIFYTWTRTSVK